MNPLTNVKNINKINEREQELGISGKSSWHQQYRDSAYIFIGGLPFDLNEGDILCVFSQYGEIVNINLVRDKKSGKSKGYCFIAYEDQRSTILAVDNLNGIKVLGRTIRVDHVADYRKPKEDDNDDEITKKLRQVGCAPRTPSPSRTPPQSDEELDVSHKQKDSSLKKGKKKSKKEKKKKKRKEKVSSDSSASDSESDSEQRQKHKIKKEKHTASDNGRGSDEWKHGKNSDHSISQKRDKDVKIEHNSVANKERGSESYEESMRDKRQYREDRHRPDRHQEDRDRSHQRDRDRNGRGQDYEKDRERQRDDRDRHRDERDGYKDRDRSRDSRGDRHRETDRDRRDRDRR